MRFSVLYGALAVMTVAVAPLCAADTTAASQHRGGEWLKDLNLSADQKAKLKATRDEMKPVRDATMAQMKALREKAKTELLKANPAKSVLDDLAKQMGQVHQQMAMNEQENLLKIKSILSKEQFERILSRELIQGPAQRKGDKPGHEGRGGPGSKNDDD